MTEKELHKQCVEWFRYQFPHLLIYHSPSEGKRSYKTAACLHSMGFIPGCPDLLIFCNNGNFDGLAVELKVGNNKPTTKQLEFLIKLNKSGWKTYICYDFADFVRLVMDYTGNI